MISIMIKMILTVVIVILPVLDAGVILRVFMKLDR